MESGPAAGSSSFGGATKAAFARLEAGQSRSLWLPRLGLGDAGAAALVESLRHRRDIACGLQKLHLGGNAITDAGVAAVAELLADSAALVPELAVLNLSDNLLSGPVAVAVAAPTRPRHNNNTTQKILKNWGLGDSKHHASAKVAENRPPSWRIGHRPPKNSPPQNANFGMLDVRMCKR